MKIKKKRGKSFVVHVKDTDRKRQCVLANYERKNPEANLNITRDFSSKSKNKHTVRRITVSSKTVKTMNIHWTYRKSKVHKVPQAENKTIPAINTKAIQLQMHKNDIFSHNVK